MLIILHMRVYGNSFAIIIFGGRIKPQTGTFMVIAGNCIYIGGFYILQYFFWPYRQIELSYTELLYKIEDNFFWHFYQCEFKLSSFFM